MSPPVISPYKKWFIIKRIVQTFLGGPKLLLSLPILFFQLVIYVIPAVIIVVVGAVVDSTSVWEWSAVLSGVGILLSDVTLTFLIWILKQRKDANITPEQNEQSSRTIPENFITATTPPSEEEDVITTGSGWLRSSTWKFIAPNVNMTLCHFCALVASAISTFLAVAVVADQLVHPVLKGFVVFTVCNARYSSVISSAPEVASFDPVNRRHLFYRSFYVAICAGIYAAVIMIITGMKEAEGAEFSEDKEVTARIILDVIAIILAVLPLVWLSGMLPPLDALFPWLLETLLSALGGKSIGYTYFGTSASLALAVAGPLATFLLTQQPKVTFLLECLCGYIISCDTGSMPKLKASLCEDVPVKYFLQQLVRPAVTILCSLLSVFLVTSSVTEGAGLPNRDIYHPVLASLSIFLVLTTKLAQIFDLVHRKRLSSRLCFSIFSMWHGLLTLLLHVWLSLELSTEYLEQNMTKSFDAIVHSLNDILPTLLTVRFFALSVTEPHDSTINIFATYLYQSLLEIGSETRSKFVVKLFIISVLHSVTKRFFQHLRMILIFSYATFSSTLLDRKYIAGAAIFTVPLTILSLVVSSVVKGMNLVPLFTLPIFTVGCGFPRPQSFWKGIWFLNRCSLNETQKIFPVASSIDWTIYADTAPLLVYAFAKHYEENKAGLEPGSCFIARYDDRLIFLRVISSGWKFCYLQVKGLEIQEQTSCHYQEAAWLDEIFDKYLHSTNASHLRRLCSSPHCLVNSLRPKCCLSVPSYSESKSQIPHLISGKGKTIFRDMFFRAFSYLWIKGNPAFQGESYRRPIASGVPLGKGGYPSRGGGPQQTRVPTISQTSLRNDGNEVQLNTITPPDMNGNRAYESLLKESQSSESIMSSESARGTSAPMRPHHHPHLKDVSATNWPGSVSYPLIPGLPNYSAERGGSAEIEGLPGLGSPSGSNEDIINSKEITNETISRNESSSSHTRRLSSWDGLPQLWMKQCVGESIPHNAVKARVEKICWRAWEVAFGTFDDLYEVDMARFYRREFAKCMRTGSFQEKPDFDEIAVRAFRYATKLTLDEIYSSGLDIDESLTLSLSSLNLNPDNNKSSVVVLTRSEDEEQTIFHQLCNFEKTFRFCCQDEVPYWMNDKAKHIVSISADGDDKSILRIFNYQADGVEFAVGELSKYCVEGIWASLNMELLYLTSDDDERYSIQHNKYLLRNICAQSAQTLGYPVYEATFRVNLFDFSLEQLSS